MITEEQARLYRRDLKREEEREEREFDFIADKIFPVIHNKETK